MAGKRFKKILFLQPKSLIFVFLALALVMFSSALIELHQSKRELLDLMEEHASTLLATVISSSRNALLTYDHLEMFLEDRLLNDAMFLKFLLQQNKINNKFLRQFSEEYHIFRIQIFRHDGKLMYSSHGQLHKRDLLESAARENLAPIFSGEQDTLILGYHRAEKEEGMRYIVALATENHGAIVLNLEAAELLAFRREIGFGSLLKEISANKGIRYVVLQDSSGIIAASGDVKSMEKITESQFLLSATRDTLLHTREFPFGTETIFEAVQSFYFDEFFVGVFRLGISMEPLNQIRARLYRRIVIISIILLVFGFVVMIFIFIRQNYSLLEKQYQIVETYSANVIQNVSDAIIVLDPERRISLWNRAAEEIFQIKASDALNKDLRTIFSSDQCEEILHSESAMKQIECKIKDQNRVLLVSRAQFQDERDRENVILVIRDLTEQLQLQAQIERQERMSAMGELASGVAHEIRNPLNSINTIVQQLNKDFEPKSEADEYHQLAEIVLKEVSRINQTVEDFLRFARPLPVHPEKIKLSDFFESLKKQYQNVLQKQKIELILNLQWDGEVKWDRMQMQQVFINLVQNSIDAIKESGKIIIKTEQIKNNEMKISFADTGTGISQEILDKIFNLYFTTKAKGTGIGLSIVQRIIFEHGGIITARHRDQGGAEFIIKLPVEAKKTENLS
ncbi:MAG: PAS domain-containing protein [Calditrichaeota bacterium]|nr:PAS domain-containing protein [Calditrichota bacterium]